MQTPPLVRRVAVATGSSEDGPADGPLLHVLAGRRGVARAAVVGAPTGPRLAWVAAALEPSAQLFAVEPESGGAAAVGGLFAQDAAVRVLAGDWRALLPAEAPFDLLVAAAVPLAGGIAEAVALLAPGGTLVVVDLPSEETARAALAHDLESHPWLATTEVLTGRSCASFVGVRLR